MPVTTIKYMARFEGAIDTTWPNFDSLVQICLIPKPKSKLTLTPTAWENVSNALLTGAVLRALCALSVILPKVKSKVLIEVYCTKPAPGVKCTLQLEPSGAANRQSYGLSKV